MTEPNDYFHFDKHRQSFDDFSRQDGTGIRYWLARDLMNMLGYDNGPHFETMIRQSCDLCISLGIDVAKHFQALSFIKDFPDYRFSKFACYLIAMNCDRQKEQVEKAQSYFRLIAKAIHRYVCEEDPTFDANAENYQFFKNRKNIGLFNMSYIVAQKIRFGEF
jgi:DNA-damage-inducible protein D